MLTAAQAGAFARVALANIERAYPRHVSHLLTRAGEKLDERKRHPAFYGSYDWHSAVHMHWLLVRIVRLHPALGGEIAPVLGRHFTAEALGAELAYFNTPAGKTFERPYGWAWLLKLHAELVLLARGAWSDAMHPLAAELAARMAAFVAGAPYPIRAGTHGNTAFACVLSLDYARCANDAKLESSIRAAAMRWYAGDRDAPLAYEPSLDDFLSPTLVEAVLMQEILPAGDFQSWRAAFFSASPETLQPPRVGDRADPKQSHLDGLALSRAWCLRRLGHAAAAERHLAAALPHATGGHYVGEHWLATFAALALEERPSAEAPTSP